MAKIDHLKNTPGFSPRDTVYIDLILDLGQELRYYTTDSLLELSNEALQLSKDTNFQKGQSEAYLGIGDYYSDRGNRTAAINNYTKGLILAKNIGNNRLTLRVLNSLATEYWYKGDFGRALNNAFSSGW